MKIVVAQLNNIVGDVQGNVDKAIRVLSDEISAFQILFTRSIVGISLLCIYLKYKKTKIKKVKFKHSKIQFRKFKK